MYDETSSIYFENNEMNFGYPNILTPPSSGNEDSPYSVITSPAYGYNDVLMDCDTAYLKIIEQPVDKFRFRYKSEMAGTHGSLCGMNSERNRKATFPAVQLCNFNGEAIVRCSLYQCNVVDELRKPHAHRLMKRYGNEEKEDPHDLTITQDNNYQAMFHSMGIIHTAKKHIEDELIKKKEFLKKEEINKLEQSKRPLTKAEKAEIKDLANQESKTINLNRVCLRFDAFVQGPNGTLTEFCKPIYSHPINNLKSALTGELKIVRMDHCSSPCTGGREIYILVEKVTKKNIKIRFVEYDEYDNELWSEFGKFNDLDVHHQYAIVFKTPPYKDVNIQESKKVFIELVRPSDEAKSERKEFVYTPNQNFAVGSKRPRVYNSSSSYTNSSISSLPVILPGNESTEIPFDIEEEFGDNITKFFNSKEVEEVMNAENGSDLFDKDIRFDAPNMEDDKDSVIIKPNLTIDRLAIHEEYRELLALLESRPSSDRVKLKMEILFENNEKLFFHNAIMCNEKKFVDLVSILIKDTDLINTKEGHGYSGLYLAVMHNNLIIVQDLLKAKAKINVTDNDGNTPLHFAVKEKLSLKIINSLIKASTSEVLNLENTEGETVMYLAVERNMIDVVKKLCAAGANVNVMLKTTGRNMLHVAVENCSLEMIQHLIGNTEICPEVKDFSGYNPLQMAMALSNKEDKNYEDMQLICNLLKAHTKIDIGDVSIKSEPMSDDDEEKYNLTRAVQHFTQEEINAMYKNVKEIPKACMEDVVNILNKSDGWRDLANILDLGYLIETNVIDDENPAQNIIDVALANGDTILTIRDFLEHLKQFEAVSLMDHMVKQLAN